MRLSTRFIKVNGIATRYLEAGTGRESIILVHGGQFGSPYSADSWDRNIAGLSKFFHVIAFDKLGMGYTGNPDDDASYTMDAALSHAYGFLKTLGVRRAHFVGHSRGGYLVTRIALERPELVKGLVIVDSNTAAREDPAYPTGKFYDELERKLPPGAPTRESVRIEPEAQSFSKTHVTEAYVSKILKIALLPKSAEVREKMRYLKRTQFIPRLNQSREETIRQLERDGLAMPTLVVWGANDPSAPVKLAFDFYNMLRLKTDDVQLHVFNHAGHYSFREHPREFNRVVTNFCLG